MWTIRHAEIHPGTCTLYEIDASGQPASYSLVLRAWRTDAGFRDLFNCTLAESPYTAFRWETPPVTSETLAQPFKFVLLNSPALARPPDPTPFRVHLAEAAGEEVIVFENLGRDAVLVVPCPQTDASAYGHLAAFVRQAPAPQQHALWSAVGKAMFERVSARPVWLSTAGGGVPWLHVRLDAHPKYYCYEPYAGIGRGARSCE